MSSQNKEEICVEISNGQIDMITGIVYRQIISQRSVKSLQMTVLVPRNDEPKPAILYFPGGGFTSADYNKFYEIRHALAQAGFVVAGAEYRTIPDTFPAPVVDGKAAIRYLKAHAENFGIDPLRIGLLGDSAGGYLVQMLGTTMGETFFEEGEYLDENSDVASVVSMFGISDLINIGEGYEEKLKAFHRSPASTEALLLHGPAFYNSPGNTVFGDLDKARFASPVGHIKSGHPPFMIMHGTKDQLVSPVQSIQLFEQLKAKNNDAKLVMVKDAGHGDIFWFQPPVIQKIVDYFKETLGHISSASGSSIMKDNL